MSAEILGHVCFAVLMTGHLLIARKVRAGFMVRVVGDLGFIVLGIIVGLFSMAVWGVVFMSLDLLGWKNHRKPEVQES